MSCKPTCCNKCKFNVKARCEMEDAYDSAGLCDEVRDSKVCKERIHLNQDCPLFKAKGTK
jgi:hypothetical protein